MSPLCREIEKDGKTIQVDIYQSDDGSWILEVIDQYNSSLVWDAKFISDKAALKEAMDAVEKEGIDSLIGLEPEGLH